MMVHFTYEVIQLAWLYIFCNDCTIKAEGKDYSSSCHLDAMSEIPWKMRATVSESGPKSSQGLGRESSSSL